MRVLLLTRSLERGGAERQLVSLARGMSAKRHQVAIAVYYAGGTFEAELEDTDVSVIDLAKRGRWDLVRFAGRYLRAIRHYRPDVVYSFLPTSNLIASVLAIATDGVPVVWGIRASQLDLARYDPGTQLSYRAERWLARLPARIVTNSEASARFIVEIGYPKDKVAVIPNGIDIERFQYDPERREQLRRAWGVADGALLIGMVARLDPVKDHRSFLVAMARVAAARADVRFVCVGTGPPAYRARLRALAAELGMTPLVRWEDGRDDMPSVYSAVDIVVSSSSSESFPNVLAEAMSCDAPCVATDVGDSRAIIGSSGEIVPAGDPDALALACLALADQIRSRTGDGARRRRIARDFSVDSMVRRTAEMLRDVASRSR